MSELLLDRAGRRRSPATMPGFHAGRAPRKKRYPADPPMVEEVIAGRRLRALVVILGRAGPRIQEALTLTEGDLDQRRCSLLVRRGKGGRRCRAGMGAWGWEALQPWLDLRPELPVGALLCVINDTTRGDHWSPAAARGPRRAAPDGCRGSGPAPLRAAPAAPRPRGRDGPRGVPLIVLQRQLGHSNLGITSVYLHGIRQRRDHRDRARATGDDDSGQRVAATLIDGDARHCSSRALR